ncbi:MAG: hypothetical protein HY843_05280, partial [Bdellovibrio sp.]|nr:hypothetical protein [Bdellovibrio sp.]
MKNREEADLNFLALIIFGLVIGIFCTRLIHAKNIKLLRLNNNVVATVKISPKGTIISFPTKPTKVILGNKGSFGIEYVENDLAVSALSSHAQSNLFVYLEGRRFAFNLSTS